MVFIADTQLNSTIKWNSDQRFNIVLGKHNNSWITIIIIVMTIQELLLHWESY